MVTEARRIKMQRTLGQRIKGISFAFEDLYDPHNMAAGIRTLEALGFENIAAIAPQPPTGGTLLSGKVAKGARRWVDFACYDSTEAWKKELPVPRPRIWAAHVHPGNDSRTRSLTDWTPAAGPTVFVLGNEHRGISPEMVAHADILYSIPMYGMVESYNVSVACSLTAWHVRQQLDAADDISLWKYTEAEKIDKLENWLI